MKIPIVKLSNLPDKSSIAVTKKDMQRLDRYVRVTIEHKNVDTATASVPANVFVPYRRYDCIDRPTNAPIGSAIKNGEMSKKRQSRNAAREQTNMYEIIPVSIELQNFT